MLDDLPDDVTARALIIDERLQRARWPRYRAGWRIYVDEVQPVEASTVVIDNNDFAEPHVVAR